MRVLSAKISCFSGRRLQLWPVLLGSKGEDMTSVTMRSLWLPLTLAALWCVGIAGVYMKSAGNEDEGARELAYMQAHSHAVQLQSVRGWNAAHGGVYVRDGAYGEPNPWLPEDMRQLRTADGALLNLMNPAYMSRQIAEWLSMNAGVRLRIAGLHPLRLENSADRWEGAALNACAQGAEEVFALTGGERPEYRLLMPLKAGEDCLRCHTERGRGDILGGVSVRLDAAPFLSNAAAQKDNLLLAYMLTALAGAAAVGGVTFSLNRRRMLAEAAAQAKSAFLANMSHDMRTPLSSMLGMTEVLAQATDAPTRDKARRFLGLAAQALLEMVTDITDHAAMDTGHVRLTARNFQVRRELQHCLDLYLPAAREKGLTLTLDMAADLPEHLCGDAFRLRRAVGNLISNAVKFTERGTVAVCVSGGPAQADGGFPLSLSVRDSGPGIPEGERGRIFESFERGAAVCAGASGTGLGLCIVRHLAVLMGGDVAVACPPEGGSVFTLRVRLAVTQGDVPDTSEASGSAEVPATQKPQGTAAAPDIPDVPRPQTVSTAPPSAIPTAPAGQDASDAVPAPKGVCAVQGTSALSAPSAAAQEEAPAAAPEGDLRRQDGSPLRVLAAEDTPANIFYLEECLRRGGAAARVARDGGAALTLLRTQPWDVAVLDLRMPVMDGLSLLEKVRSGTAGVPAALPVVMLTATCGPQERTLLAQADALLEKPVSFPLLRDTLRRVCGLSAAEPPSASAGESSHGAGMTSDYASQPAPAGAAPADSIFDQAAALAALDGDAALLGILISVFLKDVPVQLECLRQACAAGDAATCMRVGHTLKNSAATLRLGRLRAAACHLEKAGCSPQAEAALREAVRECLPPLRAYGKEH